MSQDFTNWTRDRLVKAVEQAITIQEGNAQTIEQLRERNRELIKALIMARGRLLSLKVKMGDWAGDVIETLGDDS